MTRRNGNANCFNNNKTTMKIRDSRAKGGEIARSAGYAEGTISSIVLSARRASNYSTTTAACSMCAFAESITSISYSFSYILASTCIFLAILNTHCKPPFQIFRSCSVNCLASISLSRNFCRLIACFYTFSARCQSLSHWRF